MATGVLDIMMMCHKGLNLVRLDSRGRNTVPDN